MNLPTSFHETGGDSTLPISPKAKLWLRVWVWVIVAICVGWTVVLAAGMLELLHRNPHGVTFLDSTGPNWAAYGVPGLNRPATVSASEASRILADDDQVFGIVVNGKARAYRVATMSDKTAHIVNDVVANQAVSVAFCDISNCVRVYHDPKSDTPLPVSVAGLLDGEMVVKVSGVPYVHKTNQPLRPLESPPALPYDQITPERVTWKAWRTQHPDTDVFLGTAKTGPETSPQPK